MCKINKNNGAAKSIRGWLFFVNAEIIIEIIGKIEACYKRIIKIYQTIKVNKKVDKNLPESRDCRPGDSRIASAKSSFNLLSPGPPEPPSALLMSLSPIHWSLRRGLCS